MEDDISPPSRPDMVPGEASHFLLKRLVEQRFSPLNSVSKRGICRKPFATLYVAAMFAKVVEPCSL